jgi:hypothetical protein
VHPVNRPRPLHIALKVFALLFIFNTLFAVMPFFWGNFSLYGWLIPARLRFPFGENPRQAYNFSLFDLNAMLAAHEVAAPSADLRVFVVGDSSVWGALLRPEETLSAQLNLLAPRVCGRPAHFYNLGYPTISLTKDLMIIEAARAHHPDLIIWLTTLEALPLDKQLASPIAANNPEHINAIITGYELPLDALPSRDFWQRTFWSRRREIADILRLQIYGFAWAGMRVDQVYPKTYLPAQTDFEADPSFHDQITPPLAPDQLAFPILETGLRAGGAPVILVNEPMLISTGRNSDIRYNFFYPRWAYDDYRTQMEGRAAQNGWDYLDLWNLVPATEFTDSAIHLTPRGEIMLAEAIAAYLGNYSCFP